MHLGYISLLSLCLLVPHAYSRAPSGPWDEFNYAPTNRIVGPKRVYSVGGTVHSPEQLVPPLDGPATIGGSGSYIVLDFGQEVGGVISLTVETATPGSSLSLSFTESSEFISPLRSDDSCRSVPTMDSDGVQFFSSLRPPQIITQAIGEQRGGFRYLTITSTNDESVIISNVSVYTTWMPHWDDLRAYNGYFFVRDPVFHDPDFLTKLWYAGAYTVQTNTIDSHQARQQPCPDPTDTRWETFKGWANNASGGPVDGPILVDGAKRDRFVPYVDVMVDPATGSLQYSGPPINAKGSDTYIGWSLIGAHSYYMYTGDLDFIRFIWANYTKALTFLEGQVDSTGLMNVPQSFSNDWGRDNGQGYNSAANAILLMDPMLMESFKALVTAADLATHLGFTKLAATYAINATALKVTYNRLLWDNVIGLFRDNPTSTLHPQDGNSLAVLFNVTNNTTQNAAISRGLTSLWTDIGPLSPELNDTIIPFVGGFEIQAHFIAGQGERALDLLRRGEESRYQAKICTANDIVQSTLLEGFTRNGSLGHGWATGPTPALTFYVLGLKITSPQGAKWSVAPVLSGLDAAEGGFTTSLGWFGVKWGMIGANFVISVDVPVGTEGTIQFPRTGPIQETGQQVAHTNALIIPTSTYAQNEAKFDCRLTTGGARFDLTSLAGEHNASRKRETPPTSTVDLLRFNLCADLKKQEDAADSDQCPSGTRACLTQINSKPDEKDRVISVISLMSGSTQNLAFELGTASQKSIKITSTGTEYPHPTNSTPIHQLLTLTLLCTTEEAASEPIFKSYDGSQVVVDWSTPAGCPIEGESDEKNGDDKPDNTPHDDEQTRYTGSGIGWFFLVVLIAFAAYFGLGAYYNYTNYGARGADLLPHRDFWKEVPYMLRDVIGHLCSSMAKKTKKWYVVIVGKRPGVYDTWSEASLLVSNVSGAIHESFNTEEEALRTFLRARDHGATKTVGIKDEANHRPRTEGVRASPTVKSSQRVLETPQSLRSPLPVKQESQAEARAPSTSSCNNDWYKHELESPRNGPRVAVRMPPDLLSYPSDTDDEPFIVPPKSFHTQPEDLPDIASLNITPTKAPQSSTTQQSTSFSSVSRVQPTLSSSNSTSKFSTRNGFSSNEQRVHLGPSSDLCMCPNCGISLDNFGSMNAARKVSIPVDPRSPLKQNGSISMQDRMYNSLDSSEILFLTSGSRLMSESPIIPSSSSSRTGLGGEDLSLSELSVIDRTPVPSKPFSLLAPARDLSLTQPNDSQHPDDLSHTEDVDDNHVEQDGRRAAKQREDKLQSDIFILKKLNASFAIFNEALQDTGSANERIAMQLEQTDALLNKYINILSKSEEFTRLIFDQQWQGADADEEAFELEKKAALERARVEAEEKEATRRQEEERRQRDEQERSEREKERLEHENKQKLAAGTRGSGRGVRGTRASMRGTGVGRGTTRAGHCKILPLCIYKTQLFAAPSGTSTRGRQTKTSTTGPVPSKLPMPSQIGARTASASSSGMNR
ncbi:hypothetical protein H0H93_012378 [Arthromyces matolae]|nr:hypothetical protein H0H93_012378 [Arthromyces matolae]